MKLYIASSWRNIFYPEVVKHLRSEGFDCYDFRNPAPDDHGFSWSEIDPNWKQWTREEFRAALHHPIARRGFTYDATALHACDACVLVLPCNRSAHLEAGVVIGAGKPVVIYLPEPTEPELMYGLADAVAISTDELTQALHQLQRNHKAARAIGAIP